MAEPKREAWHVRLRQWAARSLAVLARPDGAAGAIVADNTPYIDDGVNYGLPLALPDWYPAEVRAELVKVAAMREASSVYHHQFDKPYLTGENLSMFPTADPLREWDHQTRREVLSRCHLAYERNPLAGSAIGLTTFFAVGEGFTVTCRNPDVQAVIDEFRANPENAIEQYEKEFCNDLQVDGELFIRFHQDEEGQVVITVVPPWEIDWIETEMGFAKRVKAYHQNGSQSTGKPGEIEAINEDLPAGQVLHVAINKHSYHTRGKSELFRILPWLKAYKDWLEGRARQNHWRGSLLFDVALAGATPQQVAAKRAQYKQPPPPGSLAIHNDKETWSVIDPKVGAADVSEDGRQMKLMSAVGVKLPEYMLSDGENANLASATAQQLPALRKFVDLQDVNVSQVWKPIYRRVILAAIAAGRLTEEVEEYDSQGELVTEELPDAAPAKAPEIDPATGLPKVAAAPKVGPAKKIKAIDAFDVVGPEIETSDPKTLADALAVASGQDWVSAETASQKMGFDYYVEQKKIDKHLRKKQQRMAQGAGYRHVPDAAGGLRRRGRCTRWQAGAEARESSTGRGGGACAGRANRYQGHCPLRQWPRTRARRAGARSSAHDRRAGPRREGQVLSGIGGPHAGAWCRAGRGAAGSTPNGRRADAASRRPRRGCRATRNADTGHLPADAGQDGRG